MDWLNLFSMRGATLLTALFILLLVSGVTHQEILVTKALGLGDATTINPSGGALAGNPMMAAGLSRIGEAARRIWDGSADRAVAHATSGPCLQQNLVCVMEGN